MKYYKAVQNGIILAISTGYGETEITKEEYDSIMDIVKNRPSEEGKGYNLRTDLTWEEFDLPIEDDPEQPEDPTPEDYESALSRLGVE